MNLQKAFTLHLDALLVLVFIFTVSLGFNLYQKLQYSELLQAFVDEKWKSEELQSKLDVLQKKNENPQSNGP